MTQQLHFTDLIDQFEIRYVEQGLDYFSIGKVSNIERSEDGHTIKAIVKGKKRNPYSVKISIDEEQLIDGDCSCKTGYNCKHVSAILLNILAEQLDTPIEKLVKNWHQQLDEAQQILNTPVQQNSLKEQQRLLYILTLHKTTGIPKFQLHLQTARQLNGGGYSDALRYNPSNMFLHGPRDYMLDNDITVLHALRTHKKLAKLPEIQLVGVESGKILQTILSTARCFWKNNDSTSLNLGKPRSGSLTWQVVENGYQTLVLKTSPACSIVLPTTPAMYLDISDHSCGSVNITIPEKVLEILLKTPPISLDEISNICQKLSSLNINLPPPEKVKVVEQKMFKPTPILTLRRYNERIDPYLSDVADKARIGVEPVMQLKLAYAENIIHPSDEATIFLKQQGNILYQQRRHLKQEKKIVSQFRSLGAVLFTEEYGKVDIEADTYVLPCSADLEAEHWIDFMLEQLPQLSDSGWQVNIEAEFPYRLAESKDWTMVIDEQQNDEQWFHLELGITVDGDRVNLLPVLFKMIHRFTELSESGDLNLFTTTHHLLITLKDGRILPLPYKRLQAILDVLVDMFDGESSNHIKLHLPRWRAAELIELHQTDYDDLQVPLLRWTGSESLKEYALLVKQFTHIKPIAAPEGFNAELRPYQQQGLAWLQFLRKFEFNGILADDMGLGKTVQALAHILIEKQQARLKNPVIVIAPTSLMINWRREAHHFTPQLKVLTLHGPNRKDHFATIQDYDLVLTTYPLITRDEQVITANHYHMVILDEAQYIKNPKSRASKAVQQLQAPHRLCLTGTPLENHLGELWSIFNFLMPGLLGEEPQFRKLFRITIEKFSNKRRAQQLAKRVAPFLLRRKKETVAKDLPPKTEITRTVPLEGDQLELYEQIRILMDEKVSKAIQDKGVNRSHIIVLDALLKLRQVCCDPRLVKLPIAENVSRSTKLELLMELVPELLEEGRRILLFSQFTSMLTLIEKELKNQKIKYVKLTGKTKDRETPINQFQDGEIPLFLISLKAGGTGLNLTAADTVIHYDPWWNPAVEAQATDRAHRIGQDKPVFVYKLITEGTVEDRIQDMQSRKKELADNLFENAGKGQLPGAEDMQALFQAIDKSM